MRERERFYANVCLSAAPRPGYWKGLEEGNLRVQTTGDP